MKTITVTGKQYKNIWKITLKYPLLGRSKIGVLDKEGTLL